MSSARTPGYHLEAQFDNIGGLKLRAPVKAAGIVVGRVESVRLDPKTYQAVVTMKIDQGYEFTADTIASILTSGLLGEVYIGLDAGGDPKMLADGGEIAKTQSAVVLEKLIGQFLFDKARAEAANDAAPQVRRCARAALGRALAIAVASARGLRRPAPSKVDPFEPMNRAMYEVHESLDTYVMKPIVDVYVAVRAEARAHRRLEFLQQHRRSVLRRSTGCCRASRTRPATTSAG